MNDRRGPIRFLIASILAAALCGPADLQGETVYLKDGSTIKGTLVQLFDDTLYFETSFGPRIKVPKDKILRIDFTDASTSQLPTGHPGAAGGAPPGSLRVIFDDMTLSSKISVHRGRDRDGHERSNRIEQLLLVDDERVFAYVDSVTDKVIRKGPEEILKNSLKPQDFVVSLASGSHGCRIIFRSQPGMPYADKLEPGPLFEDIRVDGVVIRPGETTVLEIGRKRKMMGLKGYELFVIR